MNRKYPKYRPFFTVRGLLFIALAVIMSLALGYCAATVFGVVP